MDKRRTDLRMTASLLSLAAVWIPALAALASEWDINPQYGYGWLVPLFVAYLFWRRWPERPHPQPFTGKALSLPPWILASLWLPAMLLREANPDWRLTNAFAAIIALLYTFWLLGACGGFPWMRHFAIPVLIISLAVPWPSGLEQTIIQNLMRAVAAITVECLSWLGYFAEQNGNLIQLSSGTIGVDEACSGVRSLQSGLMASVVIGELYLLSTKRRLLLVAGALLLSFGFNLVRALFLSLSAARSGLESISRWHDPAGYTILVVTFASLWLLARWISSPRSGTRIPQPRKQGPHPPTIWPPAFLGFTAMAIVLSAALLNEGWYRLHENPSASPINWSWNWPSDARLSGREIPSTVKDILKFSEIHGKTYNPEPGRVWFWYDIRWEPGKSAARLARGHSPEICLPAGGAKLVAFQPTETISIGSLHLPVQSYVFTKDGRPLYVFYTLWEQQTSTETPEDDGNVYSRFNRLDAVLSGKRNRGQRLIHSTLIGYPNLEQARAAYLSFLRQHISVQP